MATIDYITEEEAVDEVKQIYTEIKQAFHIDFVPNLFAAMANQPAILSATWNQYKTIMGEGELTSREKEIIALAVSATNNCQYCINAHTAGVKKLGLSESAIVELMSVVGLYNNFNKFLDGLLVESDLGV